MAKNENSNFSYMTRRIGGTTYKVKVVFSDTEKETMEDKILRMIRNETVDVYKRQVHMYNHSFQKIQ